MKLATTIAALLTLAGSPATAFARGDVLVLELGHEARAEWDPCPIWGELRVQVWRGDVDLPRRVERLRHDLLDSARMEVRDDASTVIVFDLADDVEGARTGCDEHGRLRIERGSRAEDARSPALTELLEEAVPTSQDTLMGTMGYLPLGAASPWSFVPESLYPPMASGFLAVGSPGDDPEQSTSLVRTPDLGPGLEARAKAIDGGDPVWWDEAASRFQLVASRLEDESTHESTLALAGESFYLSGAYDEAAVYFDRASRSFSYTPRAGWFLLGRGLAQQGMGRHDLAIADLELAGEALPVEARGKALIALATALASAGRMEQAHAVAEAVRRGWTHTPMDPWLEAELAYRAAEPKRAAELLVKLLDMDPGRQHLVLVRLVDCAMMRDDEADFQYWLGELRVEASRRASLMERLRKLEWELLAGGGETEFPDAIAQLRVLTEVDPSVALEVALVEAAFLHENGMLLDGCRLDKETLRFHGDFMGRRQVEARMCRNAGQLMETAEAAGNTVLAAGLFVEFIDHRESAVCNEPDLLWRVAGNLERLQLAPELRRVLTSMLSDERVADERRDQILLRLARLYLDQGRVEEGLETVAYYRREAVAGSDSAEADVLAAELLLVAGRVDEAAAMIAPWLEDDLPGELQVEACEVAGQVALRQQRWSDAARELGRARLADPGEPEAEAVVLEAWALYRAGESEPASELLATLDLASMSRPSREAAMFLRAKALRDSGDIEGAQALLGDTTWEGAKPFWATFVTEEAAELAWYRKMGQLIGVPHAFDADATGASSPSEL